MLNRYCYLTYITIIYYGQHNIEQITKTWKEVFNMTGFNVNMSKKDIFNAKSGSISIKTAEASDWHTVSGCAVVENGGLDRDKKPCDIGYIATDIGVFGFSSKVCLDHMEELADILSDCLSDGEEVKVRFVKGKSTNGEFYSIQIQ